MLITKRRTDHICNWPLDKVDFSGAVLQYTAPTRNLLRMGKTWKPLLGDYDVSGSLLATDGRKSPLRVAVVILVSSM